MLNDSRFRFAPTICVSYSPVPSIRIELDYIRIYDDNKGCLLVVNREKSRCLPLVIQVFPLMIGKHANANVCPRLRLEIGCNLN